MRIYHFTLCFLIVASVICAMCRARITDEKKILEDKIFWDHATSSAVDTSAKILAGAGAGGILSSKDAAYEGFVNTIAARLGLTGRPWAAEEIGLFIPVFAVMDESDIYINYCEISEQQDMNGINSRRIWTDAVSRSEDIENILEYYCEKHNKTAEAFGISYSFSMSAEEGLHFIRSCEGIMVFALFQGYPIGDVPGHYYNRFAFSGCGIQLQEKYYVDIDNNESRLMFHAENCTKLGEESEVFYSRKEAAMRGAYECPYCLGE